MESGSRRKQLRPARVNDPLTTASQNNTRKVDVTMDTIAQDQLNETLKTAMAKIGETRVKSEIDEDSGIEMRTGETRGPYPVKELRASSSEGENEVTIVDQLGNTHHFEVDSVDPILRRIKPCHNALESNCIVFHVESLIQILITKDLRSEDDLLPILIPQQQPSTASDADIEKRFLCTKCHIAKFNCYENLTAHQKFYCKGKDSLTQPTQMSSLLPNLYSMGGIPQQNVILLPLAYHDQPQQDMVQLLGPPQTIVPVAIGRPPNPSFPILPPIGAPVTNPLIIQRGLCGNVIPPPHLKFCLNDLNVTVPIMSMEIGTLHGLKRTQERPLSTPLDLSKRRKEDDASTGPPTPNLMSTKSSHSDVEKPFLCTCGISFSADETLKAHQQYYCKNVERPEDQREPVRKLPSRCAQCDYEPQSLSQLSVHVRTVHNDIQAYVCRLCGYRGYSLRGIRSHMSPFWKR